MIATIVSKLVYVTYLRDVSNLLILGLQYNPFTKYQQDIPVPVYPELSGSFVFKPRFDVSIFFKWVA